jgi:uncharacterized protein YuzE
VSVAGDTVTTVMVGVSEQYIEGSQEESHMRLTYDASVDAAYIYFVDQLGDGAVSETYPCEPRGGKGAINLDFDASGRLVGIEVLGARSVLPAEALNKADWPRKQGALREKR